MYGGIEKRRFTQQEGALSMVKVHGRVRLGVLCLCGRG